MRGLGLKSPCLGLNHHVWFKNPLFGVKTTVFGCKAWCFCPCSFRGRSRSSPSAAAPPALCSRSSLPLTAFSSVSSHHPRLCHFILGFITLSSVTSLHFIALFSILPLYSLFCCFILYFIILFSIVLASILAPYFGGICSLFYHFFLFNCGSGSFGSLLAGYFAGLSLLLWLGRSSPGAARGAVTLCPESGWCRQPSGTSKGLVLVLNSLWQVPPP